MADRTRMDGPDSGRTPAGETRMDARGRGAPQTRMDAGVAPEPSHPGVGPRPPAPETRIDGAAPERFQPLPSTLAARFTMERKLGQGGEATVWLCRATNGHPYAIKLFHNVPGYRIDLDSPEYRDSFRDEYTVHVFERGSDNDIHYEVMEFCRFGSLGSFLLDRDPAGSSHDLAVEILRQVVTKLHAIQHPNHTTLVHGDVNPRNILVRTDTPLELVFADFGLLVDLAGRSKITNMGNGTAAYSAPGAPQRWRVEDDWWSVGMVMLRVLMGHGYFEDDQGTQLPNSVVDAELNTRDISLTAVEALPMPSFLRGRWTLLLSGLLTRDPQLRWGFDEVEAWLAGQSPAVRRGDPTPALTPESTAASESTAGRRASTPFALPGVGTFHDSAELGVAMSTHPEAAARALTGRGRAALLNWLTDDVRTGNSYSELKSYGDGWGPEELATYFTAKLAPSAALTYRGYPVGSVADLRSLVTTDGAGDTIGVLYERQLLGSLVGEDRPNYTIIDADWHDIVLHADDLGQRHGFNITFGHQPQRTHVLRYALLLAAGDESVADAYVAGVRRRLTDPNLALANEITWFAALRQEARL
ncbi:serine/threonine protein kinase [Nocardia sp. NPDC059240]|uniref:serine/threonine protein kinase n=1 Tax=Nocardia sp. NPDC059240 TaxID=3346786 RepID=UPI003684F1F6